MELLTTDKSRQPKWAVRPPQQLVEVKENNAQLTRRLRSRSSADDAQHKWIGPWTREIAPEELEESSSTPGI